MLGDKMVILILVLVLCFAVVSSSQIVLVKTADDGTSWNVQTVDETGAGYGNGYCPIVVDSSNNPHIAYSGYDYPPHQYDIVRYASWQGSGWNVQTIKDYRTAFSLVLDANDKPHILYGEHGGGNLRYASWTGSNWSIRTVDENNTGFGSVVLDSFGNPHIAYTDGQVLKYANWTGKGWNIQTVDTYDGIDFQLSLALDSNNIPYILYASDSLKLAVHTVSSWDIQTVVPNLHGLDNFGNMVLDSKGYPHFIYRDVYGDSPTINRDLVYASWDGTAWTTHTVDSNSSMNIGFLALDSHDYPHISYIGHYTSQLMYARWTGKGWNSQTVGTNVTADGPCYLALDSNGNPHISYRVLDGHLYSTYHSHIMYATATIKAEPTQPPSIFSGSSLLLISAIVIGGTAVAVVFVWKKSDK